MRTFAFVSDREPLFTPRFIAIWLFQFGTFFSAFQLLPVIPLRILDLGGSKATAGLFLGVYTFASAFAAPVMGTVADHIGRRRMLVTASLLFAVFSIAYGLVPWLPVVLVIAILHGALWSSILSAAGAIMTDFIPPTRRSEGLAYWGLAPTAAIAIAPAVGLAINHLGWLVLCLEIATLSVFAALWASRLPGVYARKADAKLPKPREVWDWVVIRATLSLAVISFGYGGITSYVTLLSRERGIRPESLFFTVFALATILIRVTTSRLGDRFGPRVLLFPAFVVIPISFAVLAYADTRLELTISATLFGFGLGAAFPAFMSYVVERTDEARRARTFGSVIWGFDTGIGLGSIAIGAIGSRYGLDRAFVLAAALSCLAIPIFLIASRRLDLGAARADADGTVVADEVNHA